MNRTERRRLEKQNRMQKTISPLMREHVLKDAIHQLQKNNLNQADKLFRQLIKSDPNDPNALHFGGITKYQLGFYKKSIDLLNLAVQSAPNYAEVYNSRGIVFMEQHNYEKAYEDFSNAVNLKTGYSNAQANLGNVLKKLGQFTKATDAYIDALSYDPNNIEAAYNLAAAMLANNEPDKALEAAKNCLTRDQYCQNATAYKAIALSQLQRTSEWNVLYDFDQMIYRASIKAPKSYKTIENLNQQLEQEVRNHSTLTWEPLERVTQGGAVTKDMMINPSKPIKEFKKMLCTAIDEFRDSLTYDRKHPFYSRIPKNYRITLIASILKENGNHPPHIHESSWLSGCYYVKIPAIVNNSSDDNAGWLEFGRPDYPLPKDFDPIVTARMPEEGSALFFPSYFFHGTIPFTGTEDRIGIAFDVYPQ